MPLGDGGDGEEGTGHLMHHHLHHHLHHRRPSSAPSQLTSDPAGADAVGPHAKRDVVADVRGVELAFRGAEQLHQPRLRLPIELPLEAVRRVALDGGWGVNLDRLQKAEKQWETVKFYRWVYSERLHTSKRR